MSCSCRAIPLLAVPAPGATVPGATHGARHTAAVGDAVEAGVDGGVSGGGLDGRQRGKPARRRRVGRGVREGRH